MLKFTKPPFIIGPNLGIFPTASHLRPNYVLIFNHQFRIIEIDKGKSDIVFMNGQSVTLNVSAHTIKRQQQRLHTVLDYYRNNEEEDNVRYFGFERKKLKWAATI